MTNPGFEEAPHPFRFDFDDFERISQAGVFARAQKRVELLDGEIIEMAPISASHGDLTVELAVLLTNALRTLELKEPLKVSGHVSLRIGEHSAPEPDILLARPPEGRVYYEAADAVLVIEISISTRNNDLKIKTPLYARAGIPELWIVEPENRRVRVCRHPRPDGTWAEETTVTEGSISPLLAPGMDISLSDLF
ncbi:Uma2 family endonuclease [Brevundimonas sp.]|uniref:Uma2 family endonuclease n=1 Tax=Brevundimonas sp. TaxID=1871086 RepID=UPI00391C0E30